MGKILKVILFLWAFVSKWLGGKANPAEIRNLQQKVDDVTNEQAKVLDTKPFDYERYRNLNAKLMRLNKKISRLQTK